MTDQQQIDDLAGDLVEAFYGLNSSMCVMAMMSVIDHMGNHSQASDAFKANTALLLEEQAMRLRCGNPSAAVH